MTPEDTENNCTCGYCDDEDSCPFAEWKELQCYKMHACGKPGLVRIAMRFDCADGQSRKLVSLMRPETAKELQGQLATAIEQADQPVRELV